MKLVLFINYYFWKKKLICVSLCHKDWKKHLLINTYEYFSKYICRQLKYQHRIRSKVGISLEIIFNVIKILTLAIAPILFILVGIIYESAIVSGVYILLSPQEEEVHYTILPEGTNVKIQQHIYQRLGCCWIGKNTNKEFSYVTVFMMRPRGTLKFQFVFGFNECHWPIFS